MRTDARGATSGEGGSGRPGEDRGSRATGDKRRVAPHLCHVPGQASGEKPSSEQKAARGAGGKTTGGSGTLTLRSQEPRGSTQAPGARVCPRAHARVRLQPQRPHCSQKGNGTRSRETLREPLSSRRRTDLWPRCRTSPENVRCLCGLAGEGVRRREGMLLFRFIVKLSRPTCSNPPKTN